MKLLCLTETKKCPKCGNEMVSVFSLDSYGEVRIKKVGDLYGDPYYSFQLQTMRYIELYNEKYMKQRQTETGRGASYSLLKELQMKAGN